jgi:hypothetical protein
MEALTFLVNNLSGDAGSETGADNDSQPQSDIDFKMLREAFRELDTENLGMLSIAEVK